MKKIIAILFVAFLFVSCNNAKNSSENSEKQLSIAEKIANANGFENWKDVTEIAFTFNVDRGENHFDRSWIWKPKTGDITMMSANDTVTYNRSKMDSIIM